jgi:hypothetical protein
MGSCDPSWWGACVVSGLVVACSGGHAPARPDGGSSDTTPPDACSPNGSSKPYAGQIVFTLSSTPAATTYAVTAGFAASPACLADTACVMSAGQCCYLRDDQAGVVATASAGAITISSGSSTLATMTPAGATYAAVTNPPTTSLTWSGEANVQLDIAGDVVHAFQPQVTAAPAPTNVNPALSPSAPVAIARDSDFNIFWAQGGGGVTLALTASSGGHIHCFTTSDAGVMTVSQALLQNFRAGDTGMITLTRTYSSVGSPDNADVLTVMNGEQSGAASYQ